MYSLLTSGCVEQTEVIKSLELLRLRRDRMLRADNVVDRNHAVLFNSPVVIQRLLTILKVQNFYFSLSPVYEPLSPDFASSAEFAILLSQASDRTDWDAIDRLVADPLLAPAATEGLRILQGRTTRSTTHVHTTAGPSGPSAAATATADEGADPPPPPSFSIETTILRNLILRNRSSAQRTREDAEAEIIIKSIVLAPYRVEVLFVLCTLLNGKRKIDFQGALADMGLVQILNVMFDKFEWHNAAQDEAQTPLHGPGCGCSLDASLKIQFLRLIHNFCDRDYSDNQTKLLLLTDAERAMLESTDLTPLPLRHANPGLLCKIIATLVQQPADSIYRFWLASCVEAFLRRATRHEQLFVARTPLLQSLVDEILSGGGYRAQGSFQSAFDLLGEMTKGNRRTLQLFHRTLSNDQFTKFMGTSREATTFKLEDGD